MDLLMKILLNLFSVNLWRILDIVRIVFVNCFKEIFCCPVNLLSACCFPSLLKSAVFTFVYCGQCFLPVVVSLSSHINKTLSVWSTPSCHYAVHTIFPP